MTTQYLFDSSAYDYRGSEKSSRSHRRKHSLSSIDGDSDIHDGSASLAYSTASSVNSNAESHDSSFGGIMRVLDAHDGRDLVSFLKGDSHRQVKDDNKSLAESSLAYSTDNESYNPRSLATDNESSLRGADLLTLGGHAAYDEIEDYEGYGPVTTEERLGPDDEDENILFSPAEPEESLKQRKERKRRERRERQALQQRNNERKQDHNDEYRSIAASRSRSSQHSPRSSSSRKSNRTASSSKYSKSRYETDPEELYQTWMLCLVDALKNFTLVKQV